MERPVVSLEILKNKIESMEKQHHIEVLRIMKKNVGVKLNENKSGVFVNLSFLPKETIDEIEAYVNYIDMQETSLNEGEIEKEKVKAYL
jgi:hypothetical protein